MSAPARGPIIRTCGGVSSRIRAESYPLSPPARFLIPSPLSSVCGERYQLKRTDPVTGVIPRTPSEVEGDEESGPERRQLADFRVESASSAFAARCFPLDFARGQHDTREHFSLKLLTLGCEAMENALVPGALPRAID